MTLVDPTGRLLTEIRDDSAVAALTTRVRAGEPTAGDSLGPGSWQRFVVLSHLGTSRLRRVPVQEVRYVARCYGTTYQDATALAGAVSDAVHAKGHRTSGAGVVIFGSFDEGGEGADADPNTGQPMSAVVISVGALTSLLP
jgi:hypothetical protein